MKIQGLEWTNQEYQRLKFIQKLKISQLIIFFGRYMLKILE